MHIYALLDGIAALADGTTNEQSSIRTLCGIAQERILSVHDTIADGLPNAVAARAEGGAACAR